jgi:tetratricopeptide (TPR) repeat protein
MNRPAIVLLAAVSLACFATAAGIASTALEFDRATSLVMVEDYDGAIEQYQSFLARAPGDPLAPVARTAIARIQLEAQSDTTAAMASLDQIVANHPATVWGPEAARRKADCAAAQGDLLHAGETYEMAVTLGIGVSDELSPAWMNEVTMAAADCYQRAGESARVIGTYEKVLASSPPPEVAATALYRMGESYESAENVERAADSYARIVREYPSTPMFDRAMGKRELIDQHQNIDWEPYEAYAEGFRLIQANDLPAALATCEQVLGKTDNAALIECAEYRRIGLETAQSGDFTTGCDRLRAFIDKYPDGLRTQQAVQTLEQNWEPIAELEARVEQNPDDAAAASRLGLEYVRAQSTEKGITLLERAVELDPENDQSKFMLGNAYMRAGRTEEAVTAYEAYLEKRPEDTTALNMIGYAFLGQQQPEKAIPYFERYAEIAPEEANSHDSLGEGYLTAGRLEDAAREYERAIEIDPSFTNSYFMLGRVYRELEQTEKAIAAYERFIELVTTGPQFDQAVAALEELRGQ